MTSIDPWKGRKTRREEYWIKSWRERGRESHFYPYRVRYTLKFGGKDYYIILDPRKLGIWEWLGGVSWEGCKKVSFNKYFKREEEALQYLFKVKEGFRKGPINREAVA